MIVLKVVGWILLGLAVLLLAVSLIPLGVTLRFGEGEREWLVRVGPVKLPAEKLAARIGRTAKKKEESKPPAAEKPARRRGVTLPKPTREEYIALARAALDALGGAARRACRRVRIDPMEVQVVLGGDDPAELAQRFGYLEAAVWTVMPRLEETLCIPDACIRLEPDFDAVQTRTQGQLGVTARPCDMVTVAAAAAIPLLKWYRQVKKAHKADPAAETTQNTEEKLSA